VVVMMSLLCCGGYFSVHLSSRQLGISLTALPLCAVEGIAGMKLIEEVYRLCTAQPKPFSEKLYYSLRDYMTELVQVAITHFNMFLFVCVLLCHYHVSSQSLRKVMASNLRNTDGDILSEYRTQWETYKQVLPFWWLTFAH
jgi:hypothetical protein